jgi:hypothetical protein
MLEAVRMFRASIGNFCIFDVSPAAGNWFKG